MEITRSAGLIAVAVGLSALIWIAPSALAFGDDITCYETKGVDENGDPIVKCDDTAVLKAECELQGGGAEECEGVGEEDQNGITANNPSNTLSFPGQTPDKDAQSVTTVAPGQTAPQKVIVGTGVSQNPLPPWHCQGGYPRQSGCTCPPLKKLIYTQVHYHGHIYNGSKCVLKAPGNKTTEPSSHSVDGLVKPPSNAVKRRTRLLNVSPKRQKRVLKVAPRRQKRVIKVAPNRQKRVIKVAPRRRARVIKVAPKRRTQVIKSRKRRARSSLRLRVR